MKICRTQILMEAGLAHFMCAWKYNRFSESLKTYRTCDVILKLVIHKIRNILNALLNKFFCLAYFYISFTHTADVYHSDPVLTSLTITSSYSAVAITVKSPFLFRHALRMRKLVEYEQGHCFYGDSKHWFTKWRKRKTRQWMYHRQ